MIDQNEKKQGGDERSLPLTVNGKDFKWHHQYISGAQVRNLGSIPKEDEIFLKISGPWQDEPVIDETEIDLARPGLENFYSVEKCIDIVITVNGRQRTWKEKQISYEQVVRLAFENYVENGTSIYTVTYDRGPNQNPAGSLTKGASVIVKNKMIFNVTPTNKS